MFQFTDQYGLPLTYPASAIDRIDIDAVRGSDIAYLPVLLAAARKADEDGYCGVYDDIAQGIGAPTRDQLRELGFLTRDFDVEVSRRVRVEFYVTQSTTVTVNASRPAEAREDVEAGNVDIDWPELDYYEARESLDRYNFEVDEDDAEVEVGHASASE